MRTIKKIVMQMLTITFGICIYSSCSGDDYVNAIPGNSNALVSVDCKSIGEQSKLTDNNVLKSILKVDDTSECGIDLGAKLFFFETTDGNLGCCAKVRDEDELRNWLSTLAKSGSCSKPNEKRGMTFSLIKGSWAAGFNDRALLLIGPILPTQQADAIRTLAKYLKQSEDNGIKGTPMYDKLDSIETPVAMVAQAAALPEKISAPFTIGAPKEADATQIVIAAGMDAPKDGCLTISGESFSFNKDIDKKLKENTSRFRRISGKYVNNISGNSLCTIFTNVDGKYLVDMMHDNAGLGVLLTGVNAAIDMDNILRSVDGDIAFGISAYSENNVKMSMAAQLAKHDFLKDVDYWKKSCPAGSSITDCGKDTFYFKSSDTGFLFGVSDSNEFFGSTDKEIAQNILKPTSSPLPTSIRNDIKGQRFCMTLNIKQLATGQKELSIITDILSPLFGQVNDIIYCIK